MRSTKYDPPGPGGKPPPYPEHPPEPYHYPGYPRQYLYPHQPPGPKKVSAKQIWVVLGVIFIVIIIPAAFIGLVMMWLDDLSYTSETWGDETIYADLRQGPGNLTNGCLFTLRKGSGESINFDDYYFEVCKHGYNGFKLRWPDDGNLTIYSIYNNLTKNDVEKWEENELIGFDAPPELSTCKILDGNYIDVYIFRVGEDRKSVFQDLFVYQE